MAEKDSARPDDAAEPQGTPERGPGEVSADEGVWEKSTGELKSLRSDLAETRERLLRCQAELENYRKRAARQMEEERRYANLPLIRDILHVWDNMKRAIEAAEQSERTDGLLEGFRMVVGQMEEVLERYHCTKIDAVGQPFDPHLHQAILQQPSEEHPHGTVTQETQTGFQLHDRVVRPSQVIVSVAPDGNEKT